MQSVGGSAVLLDQNLFNMWSSCRSVLTYSRLGGHVKTLTFCQGSHYLAMASDNGSVQLLTVEANKPPKSPKVQPFQSRYQDPGFMVLLGLDSVDLNQGV